MYQGQWEAPDLGLGLTAQRSEPIGHERMPREVLESQSLEVFKNCTRGDVV